MRVKDNIRTGQPNSILPTLSRLVQRYNRNGALLKVGATSDPEGRSRGYNADEKQYTEMVVIYRTRSLKNVIKVEKQLIEWHWDILENERAGGGGHLQKGEPWYYTYLVRKPLPARSNRGKSRQSSGRRPR